MDSSGRIHMFEGDLAAEPRAVRHTGFVTKDPMPGACNARKVLSALDKLADRPLPIPSGGAALLPLTPFERGYVLGVLAEYRAWKDGQR